MVGINEAKIAENISAKVLYNNWTYVQLRGEVPIKIQPKILCSRCYEQGGANLQIIWEVTFEQGRGEAPTGI